MASMAKRKAPKKNAPAKPAGSPGSHQKEAIVLLRRAIALEPRVGKRLTTSQLYVQLALNVLENH